MIVFESLPRGRGSVPLSEPRPRGWRREDFTLRQVCHDFAVVHDALFRAGFKDVTMHDARDAGMKGDAGYGRTFFLCVA